MTPLNIDALIDQARNTKPAIKHDPIPHNENEGVGPERVAHLRKLMESGGLGVYCDLIRELEREKPL